MIDVSLLVVRKSNIGMGISMMNFYYRMIKKYSPEPRNDGMVIAVIFLIVVVLFIPSYMDDLIVPYSLLVGYLIIRSSALFILERLGATDGELD
jgi:hypothetical protein